MSFTARRYPPRPAHSAHASSPAPLSSTWSTVMCCSFGPGLCGRGVPGRKFPVGASCVSRRFQICCLRSSLMPLHLGLICMCTLAASTQRKPQLAFIGRLAGKAVAPVTGIASALIEKMPLKPSLRREETEQDTDESRPPRDDVVTKLKESFFSGIQVVE